MPLVKLFGGAITAQYPTEITDASDLRQVPDSQEVYLSNNSDLSIILEVLQLVEEEGAADDLDKAIRFHYSSLAHDNTALTSSITTLTLPPSPSPPILGPTTLVGTQTVSKFNRPAEEADEVLILLALWRIPSKKADLVLTVNFPVLREGKGERDESGASEARRVFDEVVRTLEIKDLGLFAG